MHLSTLFPLVLLFTHLSIISDSPFFLFPSLCSTPSHFSGISSVSLSHNLPFLPFFPPLSHFSPFCLFPSLLFAQSPSHSSPFSGLLNFLLSSLTFLFVLKLTSLCLAEDELIHKSPRCFVHICLSLDAGYVTWLEGTHLSTSPKDKSYPGQIVQNGVHSHHLLSCLPPCPDIKP